MTNNFSKEYNQKVLHDIRQNHGVELTPSELVELREKAFKKIREELIRQGFNPPEDTYEMIQWMKETEERTIAIEPSDAEIEQFVIEWEAKEKAGLVPVMSMEEATEKVDKIFKKIEKEDRLILFKTINDFITFIALTAVVLMWIAIIVDHVWEYIVK